MYTMRNIILLVTFYIGYWAISLGQNNQVAVRADTVSRPVKELYDSLSIRLAFIGEEDQKYRGQIEEIQLKYGGDSPEMKRLFQAIKQGDSLNLVAVRAIIDGYGWLGPDQVGSDANSALFMVIQHADQAIQEQYLALMQKAVRSHHLKPSSFALLQDRLALRQGSKQIYGSQLAWNLKTNQYYVFDLEDPDHVDQRRKSVGLVPIAIYLLDCCQLIWDVEAYKKDIFSLKSHTK